MAWKDSAGAWLRPFLPIALLVIAVIAFLRYAPESMKPWTNKPEPAQQAQESHVVEKIKKVYVKGPERIKVIEKIKYIEKVPGALTPQTMGDNTAHVIASAVIPPSTAGGTASAILKVGPDGVGTGSIEYKPATPPFFQIKREMGIRGGFGTEGIMGELFVKPVRVGPVELEGRVYGRSGNGEADFGAAVMLEMRF